MPARPELTLAVQHAVRHDATPRQPQVRHWLRAAQERPATVTVRFVGDAEGQRLNREFRGKDYATNVLSFNYDNDTRVAGDLVLCVPVVLREAVDQGKSPEAHFAHLIVHGMLHLQGYDHESGARAARRMEAREREILASLGFPDPY